MFFPARNGKPQLIAILIGDSSRKNVSSLWFGWRQAAICKCEFWCFQPPTDDISPPVCPRPVISHRGTGPIPLSAISKIGFGGRTLQYVPSPQKQNRQGQISTQGILHLRNPNLGPNSGKQILDARILGPNSWVKFFDSVFSSRRGPQKNSPSRNSPPKIHLPKFNSAVPKRGRSKRGSFAETRKCAQKSANERKRAQTQVCTRAQTQVCTRAQKAAKGRKRAQKSAPA